MMAQLASQPLWEQVVLRPEGSADIAWIAWTVCGMGFVLSLMWAFFGNRGMRVLATVQGALFGLVVGYWAGMALDAALATGNMTLAQWLDVPGSLRVSLYGIIGGLLFGLLFGLLGCVLVRVQVFMVGGLMGSLLVLLLLRLFGVPAAQPLPVVMAALLVAGTLSVLLFIRFPAFATGILGGLGIAMALTWPMLQLFVHVGGPAWLPLLSSGGLGILAAIAGTALQLDKEAEKQNLKSYQQEVVP